MKVIKINNEDIQNFAINNNYILLEIHPEFNYYLVQDNCESLPIETIPSLGGIVEPTLDGIIKCVTVQSNNLIQNNIKELTNRIEASDYKITKTYEYSLVGLEVPYNIQELHENRQALRDTINNLETQIKDIKTWEELDNIITHYAVIEEGENNESI